MLQEAKRGPERGRSLPLGGRAEQDKRSLPLWTLAMPKSPGGGQVHGSAGPSPLWGPIPVPLGCRSVPGGTETPGQEGWTPGWRVDPGRPAGLETQQGVHPGTGVGQGAPCPPRPCPLLTPLEPAAGLPWLPSTTACATPGPGPARPPTSRQFLERLQSELPPPPAGSPAACGGQTRSPGPSGIAPTSRKIAKRLKNK